MKKHVIITKLFEFGGSNTYLNILIKYFGKENVVLILENKSQLRFLDNIEDGHEIEVKIKSRLHAYAHLNYPSALSNIKESILIIRSVLDILLTSIRNGFADVTISAVESERHLYLLWVPFIRIVYILHTTPGKKYTPFTKYTCDRKLGRRKKIVTVSKSNKSLIAENWDIAIQKRTFIHVIYNSLSEEKFNNRKTNHNRDTIKYVITLGHLTGYKNPYVWMEVAKSITAIRDDVHFLWLGDGPLFNEFKAQQTEKIRFPGFIKNPDEYMEAATLYYQPSLQETHGISVLEAMYHNLPCVVAKTGGLPESVKDQYNGLVVAPTAVKEHENALLQLIDDQKLVRKYGLNSYKRYNDLFSFKEFKSKMDVIYAD